MRRISIFFVFLLVTFCAGSLSAQEENIDSTYYKKYKDHFLLRVISQYRSVFLQVKGEENNGQFLYRPNTRPSIGIGGSIVGIGANLTVKVPESLFGNPGISGDTRSNDFQLNLYQKSFAVDVQYQFYEGFYVDDQQVPGATVIGEDIVRPDLQLENYGLNGAYIFNHDKLAYAAAYNYSRKQLRSSGSFLALASLKHTLINTDNVFIPAEFLNEFQFSPGLREGAFTGFSVMPGYTHTFVVEDFFLNMTLAAGPDFQYQQYTIANNKAVDGWAVEPNLHLRAGLGYDNGNFFTGIYYIGRRNKLSVGSMDIVHGDSFIRLTVGHRFEDTPWMQDIRNWKLYQKIMHPFD